MAEPNDLEQRKAIVRIKQLMLKNVRTTRDTDELRTLATMLHVHSHGAFTLTIDGERVTK
jgi:triosephosphate isomerase